MTPAEMEAIHPDVRLSGLDFAGMMSEEEVRKIDLTKVKLQIGDHDDMVLACSVRSSFLRCFRHDLIFVPGRD